MAIRVGFAEVDITPPLGTYKIGWLKKIVSERVASPLMARVAVFETAEAQIAVVQLDTLFIAWPEVAAIRRYVSERYGFAGDGVMVAATHNHAGPAVTHAGDVPKDEAYAETLVSRVVAAFGEALARRQEAEIGFGRAFEWRVAHNRRVVMRDGTVRTHGTFDDPGALCLEGPIDPEVAVLAARTQEGELLGVLVNYACHPTHHGGDTVIDAGYPGVLARELRDLGCPYTLFLNGPSGNLHTSDPRAGGKNMPAQEVGQILAQDVREALQDIVYRDDVPLGAASCTLDLPYRQPTEDQVQGQARGAQRFIDPAIYDRAMPALVERIEQRGVHRAEIQVLSLGDVALAGVPGEIFCEYGLRIKERAHPVRAVVVSCANGRVGYIPTRDAFRRGGYETTFGPSSMLAPSAGEMIEDAVVALIGE